MAWSERSEGHGLDTVTRMNDGRTPRLTLYARQRVVWLVICTVAFVNAGVVIVLSRNATMAPWPNLIIGVVVTAALYVALKKSRVRFKAVCDRGAKGNPVPCPFCGYDLETDGELVTCPECGSRMKTATLSTYWIQVSRRSYWRSDRELLRRLVRA